MGGVVCVQGRDKSSHLFGLCLLSVEMVLLEFDSMYSKRVKHYSNACPFNDNSHHEGFLSRGDIAGQ